MAIYPNLNVTTAECFLSYGNSVTNDLFWTGILFLLFVVVFSVQKIRGYKTIVCFTTTSFFSTLISFFMSSIKCGSSPLISSYTVLFLFGISVLSFVFMIYQENNG